MRAYGKRIGNLNYSSNVESIGEKQINESAISVYIPMQGEGLWQLSKRLNIPPEKLLETNHDLQFPLSGDERIVIYRSKE